MTKEQIINYKLDLMRIALASKQIDYSNPNTSVYGHYEQLLDLFPELNIENKNTIQNEVNKEAYCKSTKACKKANA